MNGKRLASVGNPPAINTETMVTSGFEEDSVPEQKQAPAYLMTVVEVDRDDRILCQAEGCGHSVYKRIHVVLVGLEFKVLGSQCYLRLYGHLDQTSMAPHYGTGDGRRLTAEERLELVENTAEFVARLEAEREEYERRAAAVAAEQQRAEETRAEALRQHQAKIAASIEERRRLHRPLALSHQSAADDPQLATAKVHARRLLQQTNPGMDFDSAGWSGLVTLEAKRMIREGKVPIPQNYIDDES
jgi:hypothetical protein